MLELEPDKATASQVKRRLSKRFPNVQFCQPKHGKPYALARVHTVTLISSTAGSCIHQRPIEGATNEIGAMPSLVRELHAAYGRTNLIEMLTTDAGNTCLAVASIIVDELHWDYFSQFKSEQGELSKEAERVLGRRQNDQADFSYSDTQNGSAVTYHIWCHDLQEHGWLDWSHARQIVRVQRTAEHPTTGQYSVGNRYYVTSKPRE